MRLFESWYLLWCHHFFLLLANSKLTFCHWLDWPYTLQVIYFSTFCGHFHTNFEVLIPLTQPRTLNCFSQLSVSVRMVSIYRCCSKFCIGVCGWARTQLPKENLMPQAICELRLGVSAKLTLGSLTWSTAVPLVNLNFSLFVTVFLLGNCIVIWYAPKGML